MVTAHDPPMRSAMYRGEVVHQRLTNPQHSFRYRVVMPLLFLDEIDAICARGSGWSSTSRAPVEWRRSDYLTHISANTTALRDSVIATAVDHGRPEPRGPIALLANVRTWGWQFNPIALYYCFDQTGSAVETMIAEVTNTPWKQRHAYVIAAPGEHELTKALHVSPFMSMDYSYLLRYTEPNERLNLTMTNTRDGAAQFRATMTLRRSTLDHRASLSYAVAAMPARVTLGIYFQALRL